MAALTRTAVDRATPKDAPYRLWDARVPGLFLRVQPSGVKTYNVQWSRASSKSLGRHPALTLEGARRQALAILNDAASASDGVPEAVKRKASVSTLRDFVESEYAPWAAQNMERGEEAVARIQRVYGSLWKVRLADVDQKRVEDVLTARRKDGTARATINRDLGTLKAALAKAVEWGFLAANPLRSIKPGRVDSAGVVRYLTKPEEARLRKALAARDKALVAARARTIAGGRKQHAALQALAEGSYADHLTPLVLVAMNTGCRRGELLQLAWSDVDLACKTVTIRAATAKSGKTRHVPLNREAMDALKHWQEQGDAGRVFPVGDPKKAWGALLDDAKVTNFRFHDLRHHFASKLVMAGVDLNTVRELLGHGDIKMTLRYAHLAPEHKAAAVELLLP